MITDVLPLNPSTILVDEHHEVILLHEFGTVTPALDTMKIADLWQEFKKHDVLFTDTIKGDLDAFVDILMNSRSVWFEIHSFEKDKPIGVASISHVIPGYDAKGHFAFWDGRARGKEGLCHKIMTWVMDRYKLNRISCEIPSYQSGVIRFTERLGLKHEGTRREGVFKNSSWVDLEMFGILRSELEEITNGTD